ncbi:MAG: hypothetical protein KAR40_06215 [Candidatus Sabulitectum sp.]|nr:hypothetical protein [Candidatus Sabulitectum sp.]
MLECEPFMTIESSYGIDINDDVDAVLVSMNRILGYFDANVGTIILREISEPGSKVKRFGFYSDGVPSFLLDGLCESIKVRKMRWKMFVEVKTSEDGKKMAKKKSSGIFKYVLLFTGLVILFHGEPDLLDGVITFLMGE